MTKKTEIRSYLQGNSVMIELPVDLLVWACENNPEGPLKVHDKAAFARWMAENIIEYDEDEAGNTAFFRLLDELFDEAAIVLDAVEIVEDDE